MKRSGIQRKTPMPPGQGFRSKPASNKAPGQKSAMKSRGPKMTPIRKSAKGEACTLRFPCCNGDKDTVVWCHSNQYADGKGAGLKARDEEGCYGCFACHTFLDGGYAGKMPRSLVEKYFDLARTESQAILKRKGLMA